MICDLFELFLDFSCDFALKQRLNLKIHIVQVHERKKSGNVCQIKKLTFLPSMICDLLDVFRDFELGTLLFFGLKSMHTLVSYVSLLNFMAHTELYSNLETPKKLCPNNCNLAPTYNSSCLHLF